MTVAAFVVAAASYAAVTPTNEGTEVTVEKGKTEASVVLSLKKGSYALSADGAVIKSVTSEDGNTTYASTDITVGDKGASVKVTIEVTQDDEKEQKAVVKVTPTSADWKAYVEARQNTEASAFTVSQGLPSDEDFEKDWRDELIAEGVELQEKINKLGIDEYNKYVDEGKLADLEERLSAYETKADAKAANKKQYDAAIAAWKNVSLAELEAAYNASDKSASPKGVYDQTKESYKNFKDEAYGAYKGESAATSYSDSEITKKISALEETIAGNTKSIAEGNENNSASASVQTAVDRLKTVYNNSVDKIYTKMVAIEKDTYDDKYKESLAELNKLLKIVNDVEAQNNGLKASGKNTTEQAADLIATLPAADKFDEVIAENIKNVSRWKAAYDRYAKAISDKKSLYESSWVNACKDNRKDSKNASISAYFTGKRSAIINKLDALKAALDASNKKHEHETEGNWNTGVNSLSKINAAVDELNTDEVEYDNFVRIENYKNLLNKRWDNSDKNSLGIKQQVEAMKQGDFVATAHFSSKAITDAIADYEKAGNVYVLGSQYDKDASKRTPCASFLSNKELNLWDSASGAMRSYENAAATAFNNYKTIAASIEDYKNQIDGKKAEGTEGQPDYVPAIASWSSIVKNENVTIDGKIGSKSYADAKAEYNKIYNDAKDALKKALAIAANKENDFSAAMKDCASSSSSVDDAATAIETLKSNYANVVNPWLDAVKVEAAQKAKAEAVAKVAELQDELKVKVDENFEIINYDAKDYGTAAAKVLNDSVAKYNLELEAELVKINKVPDQPEQAIVYIDIVKENLAGIQARIEEHNKTAEAWKTTYSEVLDKYNTVYELINGKNKGKKSVSQLLGSVNEATSTNAGDVKTKFAGEVTTLNNSLSALWSTIDATEDIAAGRPDSKTEEGTDVKGFDSQMNELEASVKALRGHAEDEDKNQRAKNDWDNLIAKYRTQNKTSQSVEDILKAAEAAIKAANGNKYDITNGESYYLQLIQSVDPTNPGYRKQVENFNATAGTDYVAKTADGYTDATKNLSSTYTTLKTYIDQIVAAVDKLGDQAKINETEYAAQAKKLDEVKKLYNDVNLFVNSSESYEGEAYQEAFDKAVKALTDINTKIKKYEKDVETWYAGGECHAKDAGATTIAGYGDELTGVKNSWEAGDNSYDQAVANDNAKQKANYDAEWKKLHNLYYGTTDTDGVLGVIGKLKGLTQYSDKVTDDIKAIVAGDKSLYTKADIIADLKKETDDAYNAVKNGHIWLNESYVKKVTDLKTEIENMRDAYAKAINDLAKADYQAEKVAADAAITQAKSDISTTITSDANEVTRLMSLAKVSSVDSGSVLDIQKLAKDSEDDTDFAYTYVYTVKDLLAKVAGLCENTKNLAAQDYYKKAYNSVNTESEANMIADFYYVDNATAASPSADFVKGGYSAIYAQYLNWRGAWGRLENPEYVSFDNYTYCKTQLDGQLTTYKKDGKDVACTAAFKEAYDANEQYKTNKANEIALNAANAEIQVKIADAKKYAVNLLVEHDIVIAEAFANVDKPITNVSDKTATLNKIDAIIKNDIFKKEYVNVGHEVTKLRKAIENLTDGDDKSALVGKADKLNSKNETIYGDLTVGKKDEKGNIILDENHQPVCASFNETYVAYLQIEKDVADVWTSINETAESDALTAVNNKVAEAKKAIADATSKQQASHTKNKGDFQKDVDRLDASMKVLEEKITLQGVAVIVEKDNNIKTAESIIADAKSVSAAIDNAEVNYNSNDDFVSSRNQEVVRLKNKLNHVVEAIGKLDYVNDLDKDETPYWAESYASYVQSEINNLVTAIENRINGLEGNLDNSVREWGTGKDDVDSKIDNCDNTVNKLYNHALYVDGQKSVAAIKAAGNGLREHAEAVLTADNDEKDEVFAKISDLNAKANNAKNYLDVVVIDNNAEASWVRTDVAGNTLETWTYVTREDGHKAVKDVFAEISAEIKAITESIITPGAITNGQTVEAGDVALIRDFILMSETPETDTQRKAADVNGNGFFDVADLVSINNKFLYGKYSGLSTLARSIAAPTITSKAAGELGMFVNASNLNLTLDTEMPYAAIQLDLTMPAGVVMTDVQLASDVEGAVVKYNKIGDATWRVLIYSNDNSVVVSGNDFLNVSLAGQGVGTVSVDNVKGATAKGTLIPIPGVQDEMRVVTGIDANVAGEGNSFFYGVDATVRKSIDKGITIIKDAANKVKKVFNK